MKTIAKSQYEILEVNNEILFRTNLNGLITGVLRNLDMLDAEVDDSVICEIEKIYDVLLLVEKKGVKEIYFEDCRKKKAINSISMDGDDYYTNEICDAILLILNDIHLYGDTQLIDILFNERYMSVLNDYYAGKHTKESFEQALSLD